MTKIEVVLHKRGSGPDPEKDWLFEVHGSWDAGGISAYYAEPEDVRAIVRSAIDQAMAQEQSQCPTNRLYEAYRTCGWDAAGSLGGWLRHVPPAQAGWREFHRGSSVGQAMPHSHCGQDGSAIRISGGSYRA